MMYTPNDLAKLERQKLEREFITRFIQLGGNIDLFIHDKIKPIPHRKFRFDFAYPGKKIAFEIQGGTQGGDERGRHVREPGYTNDCEKLNLAQLIGWRVFWITSKMLKNPRKYIKPVIEQYELDLPF